MDGKSLLFHSIIHFFYIYFIVLPVVVQSLEGTLLNMSDAEQHNQLCEKSKLLGEKVKMIKSALKRPGGVSIGLLFLR